MPWSYPRALLPHFSPALLKLTIYYESTDVLSQAIIANNTAYCSGAIGIDPSTGNLIHGTVTDRTVSLMAPQA